MGDDDTMSTREWSCWLALSLAPAFSVVAALGPKVMILVDEKSLGTVATSEIEALAVLKLAEQNVDTVDQDMVRANLKRAQQALKSAGDNRGAAALGREFGADIILVGEAVCKPSAKRIAESNLRAYQAVVTLRAVRTDNAINLGSASEDVSVVALDDVSGSAKALRAAGEKALDVLIPIMVKKWQAGGATLNAVEITVGGVDQIWKLQAIREALKNRSADVPTMMQKSYAQGAAIFRVESRLPSEQLAEDLVLRPPQGLKLQVVEILPAALNLRAVEAQ